jgi:hypothetical protein
VHCHRTTHRAAAHGLPPPRESSCCPNRAATQERPPPPPLPVHRPAFLAVPEVNDEDRLGARVVHPDDSHGLSYVCSDGHGIRHVCQRRCSPRDAARSLHGSAHSRSSSHLTSCIGGKARPRREVLGVSRQTCAWAPSWPVGSWQRRPSRETAGHRYWSRMAEKTSSVIPTISVRHWATVDSDELMPAGRPLTSQRASRRDPMASARVVSCPLQNLAQRPRLRRAVRGSPTVACRRAAYACGVWPQLTKEPRVAATAPGAERASGPGGFPTPGIAQPAGPARTRRLGFTGWSVPRVRRADALREELRFDPPGPDVREHPCAPGSAARPPQRRSVASVLPATRACHRRRRIWRAGARRRPVLSSIATPTGVCPSDCCGPTRSAARDPIIDGDNR